MDLPWTLAEFAELAAGTLPAPAHGYFAGGAGDEITLRANVTAWQQLSLRQRVLVDVAQRDLSVRLLGRDRPHPLVVAPMAFQATAHPGGEAELARGAAAVGAPYCLSTLATTGVAELAAAAPEATRWFQVYVFRDRGLTREFVTQAAAGGYEALVVTVDLPVFGWRDRDVRSGFTPTAVAEAPMVAAAGGRGPLTPAQAAEQIDPALGWADLAEFIGAAPLPVLVKGVLHDDDARRAADAGAAGIVVSNHGGRQLDTVMTTAAALPAVVDAVGGRVEVLVDGGIRRGTDVLKALAMGAGAVLVGRPLLWGLAVGGADGVSRVLAVLLREFDVALALTGCPRARDLDRAVLA